MVSISLYFKLDKNCVVLKHILLLLVTTILCSNSYGQGGNQSIARVWYDVLLNAIRTDFARPTVHARNLYHLSIAHYDAFHAYDPSKETFLLGKDLNGWSTPYEGVPNVEDIDSARHEAICYASYKLLYHRFQNSPGFSGVIVKMDSVMLSHDYGFDMVSTDYVNGGPREFGNYIASQIIGYGLQDGSNEQNNYGNLYYQSSNPPIEVEENGNPDIIDPNRWQAISLTTSIDQSGNPVASSPPHLSPEWGNVDPFSLDDSLITTFSRNSNDYNVFFDPGEPAYIDTTDTLGLSSLYKWNFCMVSVWQSHLDPNDGVMIDISPASRGGLSNYPQSKENHPAFYDFFDGGVQQATGHALNPVTGIPYDPQVVPMGDYGRVLAEFWADGIDSETPPGHWFEILHTVTDHPLFEKKWMGLGNTLSDLEYDVRSHFVLGGAMHDAAVTSWSIKGWYDYLRPVSAIRYMAELGQCSDTNLVNFHPGGIPLIPDYIELVNFGDPLVGSLNENYGKIKLYTWKGPDSISNPETDIAGVGWILAENWWPYQRPTFVTPPFAGYISGHSTFSRTAAEILTFMTGTPYFPGGMSEFFAEKNEFLEFEEGPSVDITLQWATYRDASDECSLSRIWGGIHPPVDDIPGRLIGQQIGEIAFNVGNNYISNKRPYISGLSSSDSILNISFINDVVNLEIIFDTLMDTLYHPQINYLSDNPLTNMFTETSSYWIDSSMFFVSYDINNYEEEFNQIVLQVDSALASNGIYQNAQLFVNPFIIDTRSPEIDSLTPSATLLNNINQDSLFFIYIEVSEYCDTSLVPSFNFIEPVGFSSLNSNTGLSFWQNESVYRAVFDIDDNDEIIDTVKVSVDNIHDLAGNEILVDTFLLDLEIDTKEPLLVDYQLNTFLLNRQNIGTNSLEVLLTFDKKMNVNDDPELRFNPSSINPSLLEYNSSSQWLTDTTCLIYYDLLNSSDEVFNINLLLDSLKDLSGNSPSPNIIENVLNIDTKRPVPITINPLNNPIYDGNTGASLFEVAVIYSESMDVNQIPVLNVIHQIDLSNSISYNAFEGVWQNDTVFIAKFNVYDENIEVDSIDITINFAKDEAGNPQTLTTFENTLQLDTKNPHPIVFNANTYSITNSTNNYSVLIVFNEDMNQAVSPGLVFSDLMANNALMFNPSLSQWYNENTYEKVYDINNVDLSIENVSVVLNEGYDIAGNNIVLDTMESTTSINLTQLGIENQNNKGKTLLVYPNPAYIGNYLHIASPFSGENAFAKVSITDLSGRAIQQSTIKAKNGIYYLLLGDLVQGIYIIEIKEGDSVFNKKILIKNE